MAAVIRVFNVSAADSRDIISEIVRTRHSADSHRAIHIDRSAQTRLLQPRSPLLRSLSSPGPHKNASGGGGGRPSMGGGAGAYPRAVMPGGSMMPGAPMMPPAEVQINLGHTAMDAQKRIKQLLIMMVNIARHTRRECLQWRVIAFDAHSLSSSLSLACRLPMSNP